jgi:hypothetical protein
MSKEFRLATGDEIRGAIEYGDQVYVMLDTENAATPALSKSDSQPAAWIKPDVLATLRNDECCYAFGEQSPKGNLVPLFTRSDAGEVDRLNTVVEQQKNLIASLRAELQESYSITTVPDGYCVMPRRLTAENGAKALLLGEFKVHVERECPECVDLDEPDENCEICDGEGEHTIHQVIPWDQIKFIYSKAVEGLAASAAPAKGSEA